MTALNKAIDLIGGQKQLAEKLEIDSAAISGWRKRDNKVPPSRCRTIESLTAGEVTVHDLRPDIFGPNPQSTKTA